MWAFWQICGNEKSKSILRYVSQGDYRQIVHIELLDCIQKDVPIITSFIYSINGDLQESVLITFRFS